MRIDVVRSSQRLQIFERRTRMVRMTEQRVTRAFQRAYPGRVRRHGRCNLVLNQGLVETTGELQRLRIIDAHRQQVRMERNALTAERYR